jgi:flagellar basal body-associated protein FliL
MPLVGGIMNRWIYVFICVLVVGSAAAVAYVGYTHEERSKSGELAPEQSQNPENFNALREANQNTRGGIGFRPFNNLSQEAVDKAQDIANSDPVVAAVLERLGECTPEVFGGPSERVAVLRYSSDEWVAQVTVDLEKSEVVAVTLSKGILSPADIQPLVHVAEREVPIKVIGAPVLRKVSPSREGAEVVFLTDQGTVEIRVNGEQGRVIHLERTPRSMWGGHPLRVLWILVPVSAVVLLLVFWVISRRTSPAKDEEAESPPETEAETEPSAKSE